MRVGDCVALVAGEFVAGEVVVVVAVVKMVLVLEVVVAVMAALTVAGEVVVVTLKEVKLLLLAVVRVVVAIVSVIGAVMLASVALVVVEVAAPGAAMDDGIGFAMMVAAADFVVGEVVVMTMALATVVSVVVFRGFDQ